MPAKFARPAMPRRCALVFVVLLLASTGCNRPRPTTQTPTRTAVPAPPASPTPAATTALLIAPAAGSDPSGEALAAQAQSALQELAAGAGLQFSRLEALPPGDAAEVALLVALPPDQGLRSWVESHPRARAVSLGIAGMLPARNLWVIAPDGIRHDQLGFALGYLAAMVTPEYRVGALVLDASPASLSLARGFVAGGTYYCGLCRPVHPPYVAYPALLEGPQSNLAGGSLSTLLVTPAPHALADLGLTASAGISFVGTGEPSGDLAASWIASADLDVAAALEAAWEQGERGEGGTTIPLGIRYHTMDDLVVSEGRLMLAEAMLADLSAGLIDTGIDPITGELR